MATKSKKKRKKPGRRKTPTVPAPKGLEVRDSKKRGRGVFAMKRFRKGDIIESCPVLAMPKKQWKHLVKTDLEHYAYDWGHDDEDVALILGFGSIYNHSYAPNAENNHVPEDKVMEFIALRDIAKGEEITVNYNGESDDDSELWFDVK